ncbi:MULTISPECIES: helix-turn-helix domain-containing protein [Actinoalloteichus]|uniref:DNA binding protein with helix-turn-helix domain n=1 Tax=Actinoalloteichus fjordicus TaxID=1612552 RepID=A0AAC9PQ92_9PSEU|nr:MULTISPECIES: helix-turn-helix transcriptional regulator [Actinoalloteichus]APU12697.1 DNA binding protein with helix-turn-helix domain [Actinoalloteichus fjordicus]APU18667.1 DNA binding protein with helix-turn-helix domain [Actinoalloteichus sp. GBA129-24]
MQVAATLRRMREKAGVTREEAADLLGCSLSKIGDLEVGRSKPKPVELEKLLDRYAIGEDERAELIEFARTTRRRRPPSPYTTAVTPTNLRRAIDLESQATSSVFYSSELIPGLLQVAPYIEATLRWGRDNRPDEVARFVDLRLERAAVLTRNDRPPLRYWCILGEAALRTGIGGTETMRQQVAHLIKTNEDLENVVIQVLPFGAGPHPFLGITVTWHRFPSPAPDILIMDSHGRDVFQDRRAEVARAAHHLDLLKATALGLKESTAFLRRVHRELK